MINHSYPHSYPTEFRPDGVGGLAETRPEEGLAEDTACVTKSRTRLRSCKVSANRFLAFPSTCRIMSMHWNVGSLTYKLLMYVACIYILPKIAWMVYFCRILVGFFNIKNSIWQSFVSLSNWLGLFLSHHSQLLQWKVPG